jgi:hypothetical protein
MIDLDFGPAHVHILVTPSNLILLVAAPAPPPGVTFTFTGNVPNRTVSVPNPAGATSAVTVSVQNGGDALSLALAQGTALTGSQGNLQVSAQRTAAGATIASLGVSLQTSISLAERNVLTLDASYDGIAPGPWVAIDRPRKGGPDPGSIPGDGSLARVFTRVTDARVVSRAAFGITGLETALALAITRLHREHKIPLTRIVELFTAGPARVFDLRGRGSLSRGNHADVTIFDPKKRWTFEVTKSRSLSRNSPFDGWPLTGKAIATIVGGRIVNRAE